jgi:hypothetical protein
VEVTFEAELWVWEARRSDSRTFVSLPVGESEDIQHLTGKRSTGFGAVRVQVTIGRTRWRTSIFPDGERRTYVLPIKKAVRAAERLGPGDTATVTVELVNVPGFADG